MVEPPIGHLAGRGRLHRMKARTIHIVGGGIAGLSLALALRRADVPVVISEAGSYPRHRVCGEFMTGDGVTILREWGVLRSFESAGARWASEASFHDERECLGVLELPTPAVCLSRYVMDAVLAERIQELGAELRVNERAAVPDREGVVRATGHRPKAVDDGVRWVGLKAHATEVELGNDLEMHFTGAGYVGLCAVEDGCVNVCGLFRSTAPLSGVRGQWREWLSGEEGSPLRHRLNGARWEEASFCTVAGMALTPPTAENTDFSVGDSFGMIAPVTGNGMSMAVEAAAAAAGPLVAWSRGEAGWTEARARLGQWHQERLLPRLQWAFRLQQWLMHPMGRWGLRRANEWMPALGRGLYRRTH